MNGAPPIRAASLVLIKAGLLLRGVPALFFAFDTVRYFRLMPTIAITTLKIAQSAITVFVSIGDTPFRDATQNSEAPKGSIPILEFF